MEYRLPNDEVDLLNPGRWDWPFNKFHLDRNDLFTTLHDRFNTHKLPLQDPMAFHSDVCESIRYSATLEEFYSQMEMRRSERAKEMNEAFEDIAVLIASSPRTLPDFTMAKPGSLNNSQAQSWALFNHFSRHLSFDTLIRFFDGFVQDRREDVEANYRAGENARKRIMEEAARRRAAAAAAEATRAASQSSPKAASGQPKSSSDASSSSSDAPGDRSRPLSPPRRHDAATHVSTRQNSIPRKRRGEDVQGPEQKRRRATSESDGDGDAEWIAAGHKTSEAEESTSTTKQTNKRKRTDDSPDGQRDKRARHSSDEEEDLQNGYEDLPDTQLPSEPNSYFASIAFFPTNLDCLGDPYNICEVEEEEETAEENWGYKEQTQTPPEVDVDVQGPAVNDAAVEATETRKLQTKSRALHRKRAGKRRSREQREASSPQKQPRQGGRRQERKLLPSVEQLLQSKRSCRRNAGQQLFFLADDATACMASNTRKT